MCRAIDEVWIYAHWNLVMGMGLSRGEIMTIEGEGWLLVG